MIEIKNIRKTFGDKTVIEDVSAVMKPGQCNLIIGTSGSGKTVLMKCMVGLLRPDNGTVLYDGKDFTNMRPEEKTGTFSGRLRPRFGSGPYPRLDPTGVSGGH